MRAARTAVTVTFLLNGLLYGAWAARIPAVRDRLGLSSGALGFALAFIAAGSLVSMPLAGWASARWGSRPVTRGTLAALCASAALLPVSPSLAALCGACLVYGMSTGALDVAMNAHGVAVERRYGRPILSSFHGAFSFGGLLGAGTGAIAAALAIDARANLVAVAAAAAVVGMFWTRRLLPRDADRAERPPAPERPHPLVVLRRVRASPATSRLAALGMLAFCCLLAEGAAADWSAVYLRRSLGTSAAVAALAYTGFSLAMTVLRLTGDALTHRAGAVAVVRRGAVLAALALAAGLIAGVPLVSIVAFTCLGAGLAGIFPAVARAAGTTPGIDAAPGVAAVSTTGYLGFLAGPPVIGALAEATSLPVALGLLPALCALAALLAGAVRAR
jgi:MFS family permease